ncbi:MAG TPA: hypothetical protein VKY53_06245 [Marinobacter sp.]|nr:hypothetical protein [Marinobacter sp.]
MTQQAFLARSKSVHEVWQRIPNGYLKSLLEQTDRVPEVGSSGSGKPQIADAHETMEQCLVTLQSLGFDTANINDGYALALDFVMDGVIDALDRIANTIGDLLGRD